MGDILSTQGVVATAVKIILIRIVVEAIGVLAIYIYSQYGTIVYFLAWIALAFIWDAIAVLWLKSTSVRGGARILALRGFLSFIILLLSRRSELFTISLLVGILLAESALMIYLRARNARLARV